MTSAQLCSILNGFADFNVKVWLLGGHTIEGEMWSPQETGLVRVDPIGVNGSEHDGKGTYIDVSTIIAVSKVEA